MLLLFLSLLLNVSSTSLRLGSITTGMVNNIPRSLSGIVTLVDSSNAIVDFTGPIQFHIYPDVTITTQPISMVSGTANFLFGFNCPGTFVLYFTLAGSDPAVSQPFSFGNSDQCSTIVLKQLTATPTINSPFTISATLINPDGSVDKPSQFTLEGSSNLVSQSSSQNSDQSITTFTLSYSAAGVQLITVRSGSLLNTIVVQINGIVYTKVVVNTQSRICINSPIPISVLGYKDAGLTDRCYACKFEFSLTFSPSISTSPGLVSTFGQYLFTNIKISTAGSYTVQSTSSSVSSPIVSFTVYEGSDCGCDTGYKSILSNCVLAVYKTSVSSPLSIVRIGVPFDVTVSLSDYQGQRYNVPAIVKLSSSAYNFKQLTTLASISGTATFRLVFTSKGSTRLTATTSNDNSPLTQIAFNVQSIDQACKTFNAVGDCSACFTHAEIVNGLCTCIDHSSLGLDDCYCKSGYGLFDGKCLLEVYKITLSSQSIVMMGTEFDVDFVLKAGGGKSFYGDVDVTLSSSNLPFSQSNTLSTDKNTGKFKVSFAGVGQTIMSATTNRDHTPVVVITVTVYSTDPLCKVLNPDKTCLTCFDNANFVGSLCTCIEKSSPGVSACNCNNGYKLRGSVCELEVYSTVVEVADQNVLLGSSLAVTVSVYDYQNSPYLNSPFITLSSSNLAIVSAPQQTNTGSSIFTISFTQLGSTVLSATTNKDHSPLSQTTLTIYSIDPLCKTFNPDMTCSACFDNASAQGDLCTCIPNSSPDSSQACLCNDGYKLSATSSCEIICPSNCDACSSHTECQRCSSNYFLNTNDKTCSQCENNCVKCSSADICEECSLPYLLINNDCKLPCNSDCLNCGTDAKCTKCAAKFYLDTNNGGCYPCISPCIECSSASACTTCPKGLVPYLNNCVASCFNACGSCKDCNFGYFLTQNEGCSKCIFPCQSCTSSTKCLTCYNGYYLNIADSKCAKCPSQCLSCLKDDYCITCANGYVYQDFGKCTKCLSPCVTCNNGAPNSCLTCVKGTYFVPSSNSCPKCDASCSACVTSATNCLACAYGYYSIGNGECRKCENSCVTCESSTKCLTCNSTSYLDLDNKCKSCTLPCTSCSSDRVCKSCKTGFYLDESFQCKPCDSPCTSCVIGVCKTCPVKFYPQGTGCQSCSNNCYTCTSATICTKCNKSYFLDTTSITNSITCTSCPANCLVCSSSTECTTCNSGFYVDSENKCSKCQTYCSACTASQCTTCVLGYFPVGSTCSKCGLNCNTCVSNTNCSACKSGYYLDTSNGVDAGVCQICVAPCATCTSSLDCKTCKNGLVFNPSTLRCD